MTDRELALIRLRSGLVTVKLDEVLVRTPLSDVTSAELGSGVAAPLTIKFGNGDSWQLEVPAPNKKHAQAVVHALGG